MAETQVLIPNYGWVPFPYFQHVMIILLLICYSNYEIINEKSNKYIYSKIKNEKLKKYLKTIISLIPVIIILFLDIKYSSFSMKNLGVTKLVPNETLNNLLKLLGGYCLIQVAAQDIGIKTGQVQAEFFKSTHVQFFLYTGVAYSLTQNRSMALIASLLYFQMKYFVSENITKDVCFE